MIVFSSSSPEDHFPLLNTEPQVAHMRVYRTCAHLTSVLFCVKHCLHTLSKKTSVSLPHFGQNKVVIIVFPVYFLSQQLRCFLNYARDSSQASAIYQWKEAFLAHRLSSRDFHLYK